MKPRKTLVTQFPGLNKVARVLTIVALGAGLLSRAQANTHQLPLGPGETEQWSVWAEIDGQDVKFREEGEAGGDHVILYTAPKQAAITVHAEFRGALPPDVIPMSQTIEIDEQQGAVWTIEGGVVTGSVDLSANQELLAEFRLIKGRAILHTSDINLTPTANFTATLYVARPISVSAGGASGGSLALYASSQTPCIITNSTTGSTYLDYRSEPLPDAEVKAEGIEGVTVNSEWLTTGPAGNASATAWAETSSEVDEAGLVNGRVRIKAVKDRATVQREVDIHIPYALVANASGAFLVGRAGQILEPRSIIGGERLRPGDVVQVGDELIGSGPYLTLWFCNGQRLTLQSEAAGGVRAVVGQGTLDHRTSVLKATLENLSEEVRSDPRRFGRMIAYKAIGNAVDGLLGIPDPVGWTVTTPGGGVENWIGDFVESAYQPQNNPSYQGKDGPVFGPGDPAVPTAPWIGSVVDFYSDGTARLYNRGATMRLQGPSSSATAPLGGMTVARWNVPGGTLSATGLAPTTGALPSISFQPENGQTEVSIRPKIRVQFAESDFNNVLPGSARCRLDGRLLAPQDQFSTGDFVHQIPVTDALTPGSHRCDLEFALLHGGILRTSITFNVTSTLPAPRQLRAAAAQYRVALRWDAEALAWARGGFRVYRTPLGGTPLLISGPSPVSQPCFVDTAPLTNATYTVAGLDAVGAEGPASSPLPVIFPGTIPPAPGSLAVQAQSLENPSRIALAIQDSTPGFTLWRIEASTTSSGPFTDVLNGELTSLDLWPVPRPCEETRQWFRVTPLNVDGLAGTPVVVGPLALPMPWPAVTGVTALLETNTTSLIQWDPYTHRPIIGYRVEREISGQWTLAADVGPATTTWADTLPSAGGLRQWRVSARFADGASPASPAVGLSWQPQTLQPGTIRFAATSLTGAEDTPLSVDIIREGCSDGPAFVTWSTWGWTGTATPDQDYTALAGLLIFAPGETQKTVQIPLLPDNYREQPNENFYAYIKNVEGGPALGEPSTAQLFILDGPELSWESTWLYGLEDTNTSQVQFTVKLSAPANHPVSVTYEFQPTLSTATNGLDFTGPATGTLTFAPGQTNKTFSVTILNDDLKEGTQAETVKYLLLSPQGAAIDDTDPFRLYATLEIHDDDTRAGYAIFAAGTLRIREGQTNTLTLLRKDGADGQLNVFIFAMGGTALQGTDWTLDPAYPTFEDGQTNLTLAITAATDSTSEGAESSILTVHGMGGPGQMASMLITIEDADATTSGFSTWADTRLAALPADQRTAQADPDADGVPNWAEYLWRTNPAQPDRPPTPQQTISPTGEWELTVTITDDPALHLVAEFCQTLPWTTPAFDAGTWTTNSDGTRTGLFRYYNYGGNAAFMRFRAEWFGD